MGDFNINLLEHQSHRPTEHYLNVMQSHSFFPTYQDQLDFLKIMKIIFPPYLTTFGPTLHRSPYLEFFKTNLPIISPYFLIYISHTLTLMRKNKRYLLES